MYIYTIYFCACQVFEGLFGIEYGLYSNAHRGKMRKIGVDSSHPLIIEQEHHYVPSRGWAEMIRKVYEVDPLICPKCGAEMKLIAFIEDHC